MKNALLVLFGIVGLSFMAGCDSKPTVATITNTVTNFATLYVTNITILTNTVIVTNEVAKEVPAKIPDEYVNAKAFVDYINGATYISSDKALFQMPDVNVGYDISGVDSVISKEEIKARFELTLRKNCIKVTDQSKNTVTLGIQGFFMEDGNILVYSLKCLVLEPQLIYRNQEVHSQMVTIWEKGGYFGTVGKLKANDGLLNSVEKTAEIFANDFLAANSKK